MEKDLFKDLSNHIDRVLSNLKKKDIKALEREVFAITSIGNSIGGSVKQHASLLAGDVNYFIKNKKNLDNIMEDCRTLKTEVWEL